MKANGLRNTQEQLSLEFGFCATLQICCLTAGEVSKPQYNGGATDDNNFAAGSDNDLAEIPQKVGCAVVPCGEEA